MNKEILEKLYWGRSQSPRTIGEQFGMTSREIYRLMRKWEIPRRSGSEAIRLWWNKAKPPKEELHRLYCIDKLSTHIIAAKFNVTQYTVLQWCDSYNILRRSASEANKLRDLRGEKSPNWKGGKVKRMGYTYIRMPEHPQAGKQGYVREHILIWEKAHGCFLPKGQVIHHLNGIPDDNRLENLVAMNQKDHRKLHHSTQKDFVELKLELERTKSQLTNKIVHLEIAFILLSKTIDTLFPFVPVGKKGSAKAKMLQMVEEEI